MATDMLSMFSVAPYAFVVGLVGILYLFIWPFMQYLRDSKGRHQGHKTRRGS